MKLRHILSIVYMLVLGVATAFGQNNTITIPDVSVISGKSINLPVNLDNKADVVAVQFTLTLPEGLSLNTSSAVLTERADDHVVTLRSIGQNKYMAMVFSSKNNAIKGRTGTLLTVGLTANGTLHDGTEHQLTLTDVVIGARNGSNLATGFSAGKVTIAQSPDLEVSQVASSQSTIQPGGTVNVSWLVTNVGGNATSDGWNEQILIRDAQGATKLLGTVYHEGALNAGGNISRSAELSLPTILSMDGDCQIVVRLTPNSNAGEPSWLQDNNTAISAGTISIQKALALSPSATSVEEKQNAPSIRFQLDRSGSTASDETFVIQHTADTRINLPESVTIPKGQSSAQFYAQVVANSKLDNTSEVSLTISGNGYPEVSSLISIDDDTYPSLTIQPKRQDVTEGGNIDFLISIQKAQSTDTEVTLTCNKAAYFRLPESIVIPAGQTSVEVSVEAIEDNVPNVEEVVTFSVAAPRHNPASELVFLVDNDVPTLQLSITPSAVSEAAGPLSITATLTRTDNIDKVATIKLFDDSEGNIYYGRNTITMDKGVEQVTVNLGPIDNTLNDGERHYNISAAVWIASCSCDVNSASSGGAVTAPLTVYDNDGPTLSITSSASVLKEGDAMNVTIGRNTDTTNALTVKLDCDHNDDIIYPATVTIPAGANQTTVTITSKDNSTTGDSFTAMLSATTDGFATGNVWFSVSDQTMPDVQVEAFTVAQASYKRGDGMNFTAVLANTGNAPMPANTIVQVFKSDSQTAVAEVYTTKAIAPGQTQTLEMTIPSNIAVGQHSYYAKVNAQKEMAELSYTNNTSGIANVTVTSPFTTTTSVSKTIVGKNEEIVISGQASGSNTADADIDVYVINMGYRHVITTKTEQDGSFAVTYKPYEGQSGHFVVGSCFQGEKTDAEQCHFDIYDINVKNASPTCDIIKGDTFTGHFTLRNTGALPLTNIRATLASQLPNAEVKLSQEAITLQGGESSELTYTVKGVEVSPQVAWQTLNIQFLCDEGAQANSTINFYIREPKAKLKTDAVRINTSVTIGQTREYHFNINNIGSAETGKISFALPSWMRLDGMQTISSLATGEASEVVLLISTNDQMQANVPVTGSIGVNCEHGDGISIPFSVEPVSSHSGVLQVDVCDEFTYYTDEAPHLAGALVELRHPTTGSLIASGTTGDNGIYEVELPEGYYALRVTANKHESYSNNVYVDPERTRNVVVDLGYTAISYNWVVEETEVEDEYKLVTKVEYETNVPVPCVVLGLPDKIDGDNMRAGESTLINLTVTNKGLITALHNNIQLPANTDEWQFEPLVSIEPFDLAAQQTMVIPIRITRLRDDSKPSARIKSVARSKVDDAIHDTMDETINNFNNCMAHVKDTYEALCGTKLRDNESIERMAMKMCGTAAYGATIFDHVSSIFQSLGIGGSNSGATSTPPRGDGTPQKKDYDTKQPVIAEQSFNMCDPCDAKKAEELLDVLLDMADLGDVNDGLNEAYEIAKFNRDHKDDGEHMYMTQEEYDKLKKSIEEAAKIKRQITDPDAAEYFDMADKALKIVDVIEISSRECPGDEKDSKKVRAKVSDDRRGWQKDYENAASLMARSVRNYYDLLVEIYGDATWFGSDLENKLAFTVAVAERQLTDEEVLALRPASVTDEQAIALYRRINGLDDQNAIDFSHIDQLIDDNETMNIEASELGYTSLYDRFRKTMAVCEQKYKEKSASVCASISLQFSQQMVMTRQAFRGTLTVFNGHEELPMTDVKLTLQVKDEEGNVATSHEFQINPESLNGFDGQLSLDGGWTLDAGKTGMATILFIPTKYAAPVENKRYSFGGELSYVDPFTGLTVTRKLAAVTLTVKPSPNLDITYFVQRDIIGDDPLTEAVEQSQDAEFALLINNTGYGDATNVRLFTDQPEIIDNEKGLKINFELVSSQLNGGEKSLSLGKTSTTDFGNIPAQSTAFAQWWLRSSLLGHFVSYDIETTHVNSYDNPDLSLLNDVTIHELIHSIDVEATEGKIVGFLTNDIVDAEDQPDMLYLSDGQIELVSLAQQAQMTQLSPTQYSLSVTAGTAGWNYGNVIDPTYGMAALKSVVRQRDGKEIPLRNFWQTDRTLRDGKDPLYENRIHFADLLTSTTAETYILTFEPLPELMLEVASIEGVPQEGSYVTEPVAGVSVMFNKPIEAATFTTDCLELTVQGTRQDVSSVTISTEDNKTFQLDFSVLNETMPNGYFLLTVNTAGITDQEGYNGRDGKQASWIMFRGGMANITATTLPADAGSISRLSSLTDVPQSVAPLAEYGSVLRLTTVPNDGYEFQNWTVNGEVVSSQPTLEYDVQGDLKIEANYVQKTYLVTISQTQEGGTILGAATGIYSHGQTLELVAQPDDDHSHEAWIVDGEIIHSTLPLTVTVDAPKNIEALFSSTLQEAPIGVGAAGYATFCAPFPINVPVGVKAYIVEGANPDGTLTLKRVLSIAAHTPVVLEGALDATTVYGRAIEGTPEAGLLIGVYEPTIAPVGSYVLQNQSGKVGFYLVDSVQPTIKANRAYLRTGDNKVKSYFFDSSETIISAIESLTSEQPQIYDLAGRRLSRLQKGINIVGGRKVLVK